MIEANYINEEYEDRFLCGLCITWLLRFIYNTNSNVFIMRILHASITQYLRYFKNQQSHKHTTNINVFWKLTYIT